MKRFSKLHEQTQPLLLCNIWDVPSAKHAENMGFEAIGTSSAAIASLLGYEDGENMSFEELCFILRRILANTTLPVTVDLEAGYSREPECIYQNVEALIELGVVGINIEDSIIEGSRKLVDAEGFASLIAYIKRKLKEDQKDIFLNVRIDTFLLAVPNILEETKKRIQLYSDAGANGIFLPCVQQEDHIKQMVSSTKLPVNVMCMPHLPSFEKLKEIGVKRVSMGNFLFDYMVNNFEDTLRSILTDQSFKSVF